MAADARDMIDRSERLFARQGQWRDQWQSLAEVFNPHQADFTQRHARGRRRTFQSYENSHRVAARNFSATLGSFIGPQDEQQLTVLPDDEELAEQDDVRLWLDVVRSRMWRAMSRTRARYSQAKGETDYSLVVLGTGAMFVGENEARNGLLFRSHHLSSVAIGTNAAGDVDRLSFRRKLTPRQAVEEYGLSNVGERTREAYQNGANRVSEEEFEFIHVVLPREDRDARKIDSQNMAFASVVIDKGSEHIVRESGFQEFPFVVPRWETSPSEIYGRSPAMLAYADARTLQAIAKTLLLGGQRAVDPPTWLANDAAISAVRTYPGGTTIVDANSAAIQNGRPPIGILELGANVPIGREMQGDYRMLVQSAFFRDLFASAVERPNMTATEILERKEEMIRVLGPTFGRLEEDYVGKTLERVFNVMERAGAFPDRPEAIDGSGVQFSYHSPFQQARRSSEAVGLARSMEMLAPVAQIDPSIMDNFDFDEITRDTPEWFGFRQKYIRPLDEVERQRQERSAALQAQQVAQFAQAGSGALRDVAAAEKDFSAAREGGGGG